jgi:hypothetical protein
MEDDSYRAGGAEEKTTDAGPDVLAPGIGSLLSVANANFRVVTEMADLLAKTNDRVVSLQRELAQVKNELEGLTRMVRTPSGTTAGNRLDVIALQVDRLHHERFSDGGGFLG